MDVMSARSFSLFLIGSASALFLLVAGANVMIDPQQVFQMRTLPRHASAATNDRYLEFAAYRAGHKSYDGLMFGSSRGKVFSADDLSRHFGGAKFAQFSVYGGMITDHLPIMQYVLRDKAARGHSYQAVETAIELISSGQYPVELMATHEFKLDEVDLAIKSIGGQGVPGAIHVSVIPSKPL